MVGGSRDGGTRTGQPRGRGSGRPGAVTRTLRSAVASVSFASVAVTVATGVAVASSGPASALLAQSTAESPALLDYFTFIPQAILLLIAVGLRRYYFADADVPWWLDRDGIRERLRGLLPAFSRGGDDSTSTTDGSTEPDDEGRSTEPGTSPRSDDGSDNESGDSADAPTATTPDRPPRGSGSIPDRLALGYENQRVVVRDGDTVDEKVRAMLRAAGEGQHTKWIDDGQLRFVRDEHGFTLIAGGDGLTRLNGERLRPGERMRVYPGDEIDLSGVVTLSIEAVEGPG